ncbi:3-deoxy-7-phosphoheptulonate synthase [Bacteroidota bacterium]
MEALKCDTDRIENVTLNLSDRKKKPEGSVLDINGIKIGGSEIVVNAGPCAVENWEQLLTTAKAVQSAGAKILRGGAFKPRTSPYDFQGLEEEGLKLLKQVREETGLIIITEVMDTRKVELVCEYANILQVGSRNMHNFALLKEVGKCKTPVMLKRGMSATVDEYLMAAEYILKHGNDQVILCERGIRTFETATRNTLDLSAVPILKMRSHLPVFVDPSHGTGHRWMVPHLAKAAIAVGADGIQVEVHCKPEEALCDGPQSLNPEDFEQMMSDLRKVANAVGREISEPAKVVV